MPGGLKNCPFCGGAPMLWDGPNEDDARCMQCGAFGPDTSPWDWNSRAEQAESRKECANCGWFDGSSCTTKRPCIRNPKNADNWTPVEEEC